MITHDAHPPRPDFVPAKGMQARLHIDGQDVGAIVVGGSDSSWIFGIFTPCEGFGAVASLFGAWSLLMHDDEDQPLHPTAQQALNEAERRMDQLHARIHFPEQDVWQRVRQINIDGQDIEWREA
jgi:tetrahydromethanopterin S-methyltransferase subunit G